jgi:hypothetical protein
MDPRLRGDDNKSEISTFYDSINYGSPKTNKRGFETDSTDAAGCNSYEFSSEAVSPVSVLRPQ